MVHQGGQGALAEASSGLRAVAVALTKIANDIRLLASGPAAGLGELRLPELQAGSSIMPGKVNPVLCEAVNQVAARVLGNDVTIGYAASQGILELNTYLPVIADGAARVGVAARQRGDACSPIAASPASRSTSSAPAATPSGRPLWRRRSIRSSATSAAAAVVHTAQETGRSIIDVVVDEGLLPRDEAARVLDPLRAAGVDP